MFQLNFILPAGSEFYYGDSEREADGKLQLLELDGMYSLWSTVEFVERRHLLSLFVSSTRMVAMIIQHERDGSSHQPYRTFFLMSFMHC